jgi:hypothetical protein
MFVLDAAYFLMFGLGDRKDRRGQPNENSGLAAC